MNFKFAKGFVLGVVATIMLSGTIVMANPVTRELLFGVRVSLDGNLLQFDEDAQPFTMDGRTFLPVRAVADAAGLDVDFDASTNTVLLTTGQQAVTPPTNDGPAAVSAGPAGALLSVLPDSRVSWERVTIGRQIVRNGETMSIGNRQFANSVPNTLSHSNQGNLFHFDLNGEYTLLTGYVGAVNDAGTAQSRQNAIARVRFFADGLQVEEFTFRYGDEAIPVSINVAGVNRLTVEFQGNIQGSGNIRPILASPHIQ